MSTKTSIDSPSEDVKNSSESEIPFKPRAKMTVTDVQRRKIQKLMSDPNKPAFIPTRPTGERDPNRAPDFVYNVMGSSAGAGSGEFHVYRQIRRKEMARQKILEGRRRADNLNAEFMAKCEEKKKMEDEKTSKKRAKRLRRKEKLKAKKAKGLIKPKNTQNGSSSSSSSSSSEDESNKGSTDKSETQTKENSESESIEKQPSQVMNSADKSESETLTGEGNPKNGDP